MITASTIGNLPTVDGGSGSQRGDEVDDGTAKAKKEAGVTLSPKCKIARGKRANCCQCPIQEGEGCHGDKGKV